ncbi:ABC transporter ATP-binding protein [Bosea sp. BK604]|uniref:ABC transporter ATP-binding protein n=1 Tax=Bosea sp. BK604 TaxID=2512180 RepID=UPI00104EF634|nr:ABC transporter ATP-binding protein [Bosea sp. BK604]TCR63121.1 amino acid/amide ABC transporter ATP-binding protein 2 (HAAT family) [Bosea sp. BK604]
MLRLENVDTNYGVVAMLRDVSLSVEPGELVCILGPNGAGKTTIFRAISALLPLARGRIAIMGQDLKGSRTEALSALGVGFVPEGRRLFADISVRDNIRLGYEAQGHQAGFEERLEEMLELFPRVRERIRERAGTLSGGEQAMVALARALIGKPQFVIMDEPSLGLSPKLIDEYFDTVAAVNRTGTTVLLIEQNAEMALSIAHRGILLTKGRVMAAGNAAELLGSDAVRHLYL